MANELASPNGFFKAAGLSPEEADRIAAVAGRPILAFDGRYYSGEELRVVELECGNNNLDLSHNDANVVVDAINAIADCPSDAERWLSEADPQGLENLRAGSVDRAIDWLTELKGKLRPPAG